MAGSGATIGACQACGKTGDVSRCARCKEAVYCSKESQKNNWKAHKPACATGKPCAIDKPFHRLGDGTWLHDRPEKDVYQLLLDAYRLRVEDDYTIDGDVDGDSLYAGASSGLKGFRRFMVKVKKRPSLLPSWWSDEKMKACESMGMNTAGSACLKFAVEKHDIMEFYKDNLFPMQLRMLAEAVYGTAPGGHCGEGMKRAMMLSEKNPNMSSTTFDMSHAMRQFSM